MDNLEQLQNDLVALLQADPILQHTPVIQVRPRSTFVGLTSVSFPSGTTTLTCASTAPLKGNLNIPINADGIAPGTRVSAITSATTLTLSQATTAASTSSTATITLAITGPSIQEQVSRALLGSTFQGGKAGATILVRMPQELPLDPADFGPGAKAMAMRQRVAIQVYENTLINMGPQGAGISAETLAQEIFTQLQGHVLSGGHYLMLSTQGKLPIDDKSLAAYALTFERTTTRALPLRVAKPSVIGPRSAISITCPTPGAQLWFTTDGTYPAPNPSPAGPNTSSQYTILTDGQIQILTDTGDLLTQDTLTLPAGILLRVAAYDPSNTLAPSITTQVQY